MDLIKLESSTAYTTELSSGSSISGYESALWVERYQRPGDFKITAKLSSGLKTSLPIGSFISHIRTREIMRVEHHEIKEPKDKDPTIIISGRSFVAYLEQRIINQNYVAAGGNDIPPYIVSAAASWIQIRDLINDHFEDGSTTDFEDCIPGISAQHSCTGSPSTAERTLKYGPVLDRVLELLKVDDLGIRMQRPIPGDPGIFWDIYQGVDRTKQVRFSTILADLDNIEYLFSNKRHKNFIRVMGRWVQINTQISLMPENVRRRYMMLDASDIDQQFTAMPTGTDLTDVISAMTTRGREALNKTKTITITNADISPNSRLQYGVHYDMGDLVIVDGNFNQSQIMRVSEFAETEDENGTSGQPTLEIPGED